mmetsp:Transcript_23995/g.36568  ORF Transcript_23995/g.36568 Transcript_23995/m.36568 type:complete len:127 (+) Transcript_23995:373-753(+)
MAITIDNGDFDPGKTMHLIKKPLPKKTSTTTTSKTTWLYLKQAAPIFSAIVVSFLAGLNYPTVMAHLVVGTSNLDSLQSTRKIPLFQDEPQVAQKEQYNFLRTTMMMKWKKQTLIGNSIVWQMPLN